jgi:flavin-dependent dehydrogenase
MRDLVVVGGGPVGLATALYAARAGLDTAVFESRPGPVDKACGEGLMPGAVRDLAALGVSPPGRELAGIRYLDAARSVDAPFRAGPGRGVRRTALHAALAAAVSEAGIRVEQHTVRTVRVDDDRVDIDGTGARYVVAADGLHSPVRRMLGLDTGLDTGLDRGLDRGLGTGPAARRRFGLRRHFAVAPWTPYVEVHWSSGDAPRAEAYVTPVADDCVGVALLVDGGGDFDDVLDAFPRLRERLGGAAATRVLGAGPLRQRSRRRVAGRVLLVGDAAGYVDALTGEGIALGLAQARAAVAAVRDGDPVAYELRWRRLTRRHDLLTRGLLAASAQPVLRRGLVPAARAVPWLFRAAVNQVARPA